MPFLYLDAPSYQPTLFSSSCHFTLAQDPAPRPHPLHFKLCHVILPRLSSPHLPLFCFPRWLITSQVNRPVQPTLNMLTSFCPSLTRVFPFLLYWRIKTGSIKPLSLTISDLEAGMCSLRLHLPFFLLTLSSESCVFNVTILFLGKPPPFFHANDLKQPTLPFPSAHSSPPSFTSLSSGVMLTGVSSPGGRGAVGAGVLRALLPGNAGGGGPGLVHPFA